MTIPSLEPRITLEVKRTYPASCDQVFRAWTEAHALERWFKPMGSSTKVTQLELCVGGAFRFDLTHPDKSTSFMSGYYVEILRPEKLVFTWQSGATNNEETLVTVSLTERAAFTEVRLTHARLQDENMLLLHQNGWESCMDTLNELYQRGVTT